MRSRLVIAAVAVAGLSFGAPFAAAQPAAGGQHWFPVASPNVGTGGDNVLQAVACSSATHCAAVGFDEGGAGNNQGDVILRHTGGGWHVVTTTHGDSGWALTGVSCPTASWCMSVGSYDPHPDAGFTPAAESIKNGHAHEALTGLPHTTGNADALSAVACRSSHFCVAVGVSQQGTSTLAPLIEQWNGHHWAHRAAPDPGKGPDNAGLAGATLTDVACTTAKACLAVGYSDKVTGKTSLGADVTSRYTFAIHFNGHSWRGTHPKNPLAFHRPGKVAKQQVGLASVACVTATDCYATGNSLVAHSYSHGFIERWNGKRWSVAYKAPVAQLSVAAIACGSASSCAVVTHDGNPADSPPLAKYERILAGGAHSWHAQATHGPASESLEDVACGSVPKCFAVGYASATDISKVTVILRK